MKNCKKAPTRDGNRGWAEKELIEMFNSIIPGGERLVNCPDAA